MRKKYFILSALFFLCGIVIYLLFRNKNILILDWINIPSFLLNINVKSQKNVIFSILQYNVPDMLWFVSGILIIRCLLFHDYRIQNIYIICFYFVAVFMEIIQISDKIPGTFDFLDLAFMSFGGFMERILYKPKFT